ncbi:hypothetical protein [Azovibrio restrictus]|uniref:hypothetical protein n=1 Tax=Azovibrio restrictus TaxID=146938 RepID=UPI00047C6930|nr:hypothetical protein [Azovibrio restrictus]
MHLNATVSASAFDEQYQMALVYCFDRERNYCFSLSRFPEEDEIEVMVLDQINHKVGDLSVKLRGSTLNVILDKSLAAHLDGHTSYTIGLLGIEGPERDNLCDALRKIFEGKHGLQLED